MRLLITLATLGLLLSSCERCSTEQIFMRVSFEVIDSNISADYTTARAVGRNDEISLLSPPYELPLDMSSDSTLFILTGPSRTDTMGFRYNRSLKSQSSKEGYCLSISNTTIHPLSSLDVQCHSIGANYNSTCNDDYFEVVLLLD